MYIWDMVQAGRSILHYLEGKTQSDLQQEQMLFDAVIRQFQVLGEAANKLSDARKNALPGVPWSDIVGMRNIIIHDYARIEIPAIWRTAQEDLPRLLSALEPEFQTIEEHLRHE